MIIGGIDPGLKGGLVKLNEDYSVNHYCKMPVIEFKNTKGKRIKKTIIDIKAIYVFFKDIDFIFVERASAMPASQGGERFQGSASMFNYGREYGKIIGWLETNEIEYKEITPRVWKRHFNLSKEKKEAIFLATRLSKKDFILPKCRISHEGICEAYLIARFGLNHLKI
jgi:hypothetical protein